MGKSGRASAKQLEKALREEYESLVKEAMEAVNNAPDGQVIAASEFQVRDLVARFRERLYEKAIQLRSDAAEAAFPPSGASEREADA